MSVVRLFEKHFKNTRVNDLLIAFSVIFTITSKSLVGNKPYCCLFIKQFEGKGQCFGQWG